MSSDNVEVEIALLEVAKDLLQASDELAKVDPAAAAKLAREAYEIGRDLGAVRHELNGGGEAKSKAQAAQAAKTNVKSSAAIARHGQEGFAGPHIDRRLEEESDMDLFRILDRQRAIVPSAPNFTPSRPGTGGSMSDKNRSKGPRWLSWMRGREWRHAG